MRSVPKRKSRSALQPVRKFADRHGVSVRTVDRWAEAGIIPRPQIIRGRKYLPEGTEPLRDRESVA
jgi:predicted site-specific integrase-resolvase